MKKLLLYLLATLALGATALAQRGSPLVSNPDNGGGGGKAAAPYRKKPMYTPPVLNDIPSGFPNRLLLKPFTQQQYDYQKRVHFGFVLAISALDYKLISNPNAVYSSRYPTVPHRYFVDVTNLSPALGVAALMDYRLSHNLSMRLQVGPTFGDRTLNFYEADTLQLAMKLESVLIEMPIMLKYKALRNSDFRPYMVAGLIPYCDASAFKGFNEKRQLFVALKPLDVAYSIGIGFDAYFDFFKFAVEAKYTGGVLNVLSNKRLEGFEHYPNAISKLQSRTFMLSLIFE